MSPPAPPLPSSTAALGPAAHSLSQRAQAGEGGTGGEGERAGLSEGDGGERSVSDTDSLEREQIVRQPPQPTNSSVRGSGQLWLGPPPITAFPRGGGGHGLSGEEERTGGEIAREGAAPRDCASLPPSAGGGGGGRGVGGGGGGEGVEGSMAPSGMPGRALAAGVTVFHDEALACLVEDGDPQPQVQGGGAPAAAARGESEGDVPTKQPALPPGDGSRSTLEQYRPSNTEQYRPPPRGLPAELGTHLIGAGGARVHAEVGEEQPGDHSLALSTSDASSPSQSSRSWTFPAYDAPASPSLSGSFSAGPSPFKSAARQEYPSSSTLQELDSMLGTLSGLGATAATGRDGARVTAARAVGIGSGLGDGGGMGIGRGGVARLKDGYESGYSSLMSSLQSLSEIAHNTEAEEREERAGGDAARPTIAMAGKPTMAAANAGSRGGAMAEADRSLEEARELEGLSSLRGSDDLVSARLREQQQHKLALQQSLDERLSRLQLLAAPPSSATSAASVPSSSARSSASSLSNLNLLRPVGSVGDDDATWLEAGGCGVG